MDDKLLEIRRILSKNLKEERREHGFSQEKLAEITGLSIQTINDIEGGRKWVSDKTLTKISAALNMECFQLLMPEIINQNKNEIPSTRKLIKLMRNLKRNVNTQIDDSFTEFMKSGVQNIGSDGA